MTNRTEFAAQMKLLNKLARNRAKVKLLLEMVPDG